MSNKVMIYGEGWTGTLPRLLYDDLARRGLAVDLFDFTDVLPGIKNRSLAQRIQRRLFNSYYTSRIRTKFVDAVDAFAPDLVIVSKGLHLDTGALERIKSRGIPLVNWNPDDFFNLKNSNASLIEAMATYDVIVSPRQHLFEKYRTHGAQKLVYLDWYYVPQLHFDHQQPRTIPASFVGSWSPSREEYIGRLTTPFKVWGGGWEKSSREFRQRHSVQGAILSQIEMSAVFSSSHYNLNLLTHENDDYSNLRFFEVPASGGLLLTERNDCANSYLIDGQECLMFSSPEEADRLLVGKHDLNAIAHAGHQRITAGGNTFSDRVDELLSFLQCQL